MICRKKRETTTSPLLFHPPLHRNKYKIHFPKALTKRVFNWEREKKIAITICDQRKNKTKRKQSNAKIKEQELHEIREIENGQLKILKRGTKGYMG